MRMVEGRGRAAGGRVVLTVVQSREGGGQAQISGVMTPNRKPQRTGTYCDLYLCLSTILYSFRHTFQYISFSERFQLSLLFAIPLCLCASHLSMCSRIDHTYSLDPTQSTTNLNPPVPSHARITPEDIIWIDGLLYC
jgi:hypothetical protein